MPDEFLTVAEVASLLKLNQQTVRNMIGRGELGHVRVGQRRVRVRQSQLERLPDGGRDGAAPRQRQPVAKQSEKQLPPSMLLCEPRTVTL